MNRIGLLFYVKKSKENSEGIAPIYLRITLDGKRFELSTKRSVDSKKWNNIAQKANGNTESIKSLNAFLKSFEQNIYQAFHELQMKGQEISLEQLKSKLTG